MKIHLFRLIIFAAFAAITTNIAVAASLAPQTDFSIKQGKSATLSQKAVVEAKVDPVKASKMFAQALILWPDNFVALTGLGDCKETITGDPKAAIPYYRKALTNKQTGELNIRIGNDYATFFNAALLFQRAGELSDAVKIYNVAAKEISYNHHSGKLRIAQPLPQLTNEATSLDVACNAHVGLGITEEYGQDEQARADFESAVAIKDTDVARYYLAKHKKEHPGYYRDQKPATAVQPSK
jgi:tetratricopeptide (TPR) repeat protein